MVDLDVIVACTDYVTAECIASQGSGQCLTDATAAVMQGKASAACAGQNSSPPTARLLLEILLPSVCGGEVSGGSTSAMRRLESNVKMTQQAGGGRPTAPPCKES